MPRYDYRCGPCDVETEHTHSIADCGKRIQCAACGTELERLIGGSAALMQDRRFQMRGIYSDGRKVEGHFGTPRAGKHTPGY